MAIAQNALKHGLRAVTPVLPDEDAGAYAQLGERLYAELEPCGILEEELVERIAFLLWRLARARRVDREAIIAHLCYRQISIERGRREQKTWDQIAIGPLSDEEREQLELLEREAEEQTSMAGKGLTGGADTLGPLSRYEADLERRLSKAVVELRGYQEGRIEAA